MSAGWFRRLGLPLPLIDHIHAKGHIYDCSGVPGSALRRVEMWLYRLDDFNWVLIKHNLYKCPEGYGQPSCYLGGNMSATIDWNCTKDGDQFYDVIGHMWITYNGTTYEKWDEKAAGAIDCLE